MAMARVYTLVGLGCIAASSALQVESGSSMQAARSLLELRVGASQETRRDDPFNCTAIPFMCEAPFNCQTKLGPKEQKAKLKTTATPDGHASLHSWCRSTQYANTLVRMCLKDHDLVKSAHALFNATIAGTFGPTTAELDGSYCFIEGHCSNTAVTAETTLEEAEEMCDYRYGHEGWAVNFGYSDWGRLNALLKPGDMTAEKGFKSENITRFFLKAACAMGNYHCDVMYCKETYCKIPYFVQKYSHRLPKTPGHLIQQRG